MDFHQITSRLDDEDQLRSSSATGVTVSGITSDSREVNDGDLFVAVRGTSNDGHDYIQDAVESGARAVVMEDRDDVDLPQHVAVARVKDSRRCEGLCADEFYGRPSDKMSIIGVTGTNGKTTTVRLIHSLLEGIGQTAGLIGTINNRVGQRVIPSDRTTPPPCQLHSLLDQMHEDGCSYAVLEVSSHGLDQHRVAGVSFDAAVFTNLSRDHLDYHGSMEEYSLAKAKLFETISQTGVGIVNAEDEYGATMKSACGGRVVTYSHTGGTDSRYRAEIEDTGITGSQWTLQANGSDVSVDWSLPGAHNVENALAAVAAVRELTEANPTSFGSILEEVQPVKGRLDPVSWDGGFEVFVDYAHTPDALQNVLKGVAPLVTGQLRAVFGCGGDRDRGKRPRMGQVVAEFADQAYVTSDNPRTEDPEAIIDDILEGIEQPEECHIDPERESAIEKAITDAEPGDAVLILGKGHETVQKQDGVVRPFKDWAVAEKYLDDRSDSES